MLPTTVYYKAARDNVDSMRTSGLKYGIPGPQRREGLVAEANAYLDRRCPTELREQGVDRYRSTYCYLAVAGRVFDVETGDVRSLPDWKVGDDFVKLEVGVDPRHAFVSDLDLFDRLVEHFRAAGSGADCGLSAQHYWQHVVQLSDVVARGRLLGDTLVVGEMRFERVEVLLTTDVPAPRLRTVEV